MSALLPSPAGRALDLGAGRGISSYALARDGWQVTALEPDPSPLVGAGAICALAAQSLLPIGIVNQRSEQLPFESATFQVVNGRQVLHHTRDLAQSCREVFRVLRPGGRFVASREHVISKREDLQLFLDSHPLHRFYGGENAFLLEEYVDAIRSAGFRFVKVLAPNDSPINYFPMTEQENGAYCARRLSGRLGNIVRFRLLAPRSPVRKAVARILARMENYRDQTPGRLYTFVASKPARGEAR